MKAISAAFVKAQKEFGPALKTATNPHFKSRYADLSACVEAVIDALNNNGIALMQTTHPDDSGVTVETVLIHESGEMIKNGPLHVPASKQDPQGYGSALTYARRYSLMAACGIAPEDDDGNAASKPKAVSPNVIKDHVTKINESENINELKKAFATAYGALQGNNSAILEITKAKDDRKRALDSQAGVDGVDPNGNAGAVVPA
jgi:hypothetical protein